MRTERVPVDQLRNPPSGPLDPAADHVVLDELSPEQRAWRVTLHLLSLHGGEVHLPRAFVPDPLMLRIAEGWAYRHDLRATPEGAMLTAHFTDWCVADPRQEAVRRSPEISALGKQPGDCGPRRESRGVDVPQAVRGGSRPGREQRDRRPVGHHGAHDGVRHTPGGQADREQVIAAVATDPPRAEPPIAGVTGEQVRRLGHQVAVVPGEHVVLAAIPHAGGDVDAVRACLAGRGGRRPDGG